MSLILEALRKREREKQVPERGFLVVAPAAWGQSRGRGVALAVVAGLVAFGLGVGLMAWRRPEPQAQARPAEPQVASVAPVAAVHSPSATLLPAPRVAPPPTTTTPPPPPATLPATSAEVAAPTPVSPPSTTEPRPAAVAATATPRFVLHAISQRDGKAVALINDRVMQEGDEFDGARVVAIREAEVELEVGGERVLLHF